MTQTRGFARLTFWLGVVVTVGFFWVNTVGFVDTHTGSALGCGHNWPLCNGNVIPSVWGLHTLIEFLHRAIVAVVVLLLAVFAVCALVRYRQWTEVKSLVGLSILFTILQSFLGALGVLLPHDPPAVLAIHLGVSLLALTSVLLATVVIGQIQRAERTGGRVVLRPQLPDLRFRLWAWFSTVFTFIAMYVGAFVSSTGAGGRFQGWPLPAETYQVAGWAFELDVLHRTLALLLVLNLLLGVRWTWQFRRQRPDLFRGALTALICVCLQALSGMLLIATSLSIQAFLTHVTIVTGLFASMCYLSLQVCGEPIRKKTTHLRAIHGGRQNASTY